MICKNIKILFSLIIITFLFMGCIESKNNDNYHLNIYIENLTTQNINLTLIVNDSDNISIFNKSFSLLPDSSKRFNDITSKKDYYDVKLYLEDGRNLLIQNMKLDLSHRWLHIFFNETEIWYGFKVT